MKNERSKTRLKINGCKTTNFQTGIFFYAIKDILITNPKVTAFPLISAECDILSRTYS